MSREFSALRWEVMSPSPLSFSGPALGVSLHTCAGPDRACVGDGQQGRGSGAEEVCPHDLSEGEPWVIGPEPPRGSPGGGLQPLLPQKPLCPHSSFKRSCRSPADIIPGSPIMSPNGIFLSTSLQDGVASRSDLGIWSCPGC